MIIISGHTVFILVLLWFVPRQSISSVLNPPVVPISPREEAFFLTCSGQQARALTQSYPSDLICLSSPPTLAHSAGRLARSGTCHVCCCLKAFAQPVPSAGKSVHPLLHLLWVFAQMHLHREALGVTDYPIQNCNAPSSLYSPKLLSFLFTICTYAHTCCPPHPMCTYQALTSYRAYLVSPPPPNTAKLCVGRNFGLFYYCFVLSA